MSENGIREFNLSLPLQDTDLKELKPGDVVYLSGTIFTGREGVYTQIFDRGIDPPIDVAALTNVTFHCSPAITETDSGAYRVTSVTGTASFRFAKYMADFIPRFGIRAVIGKTGMPPETYSQVFQPNSTVYLNTIGYGLGAIYGRAVRTVRHAVWVKELGLAQAMWFFDVEHFGPLMVECDVNGNSLLEAQNQTVNDNLLPLYEGLDKPILRRLGEETDPEREMMQ